jgi:hypothetical protein
MAFPTIPHLFRRVFPGPLPGAARSRRDTQQDKIDAYLSAARNITNEVYCAVLVVGFYQRSRNMGLQRVTRLNACAKANDYQRGYTGKKTVVETVICTRMIPRKIKIKHWISLCYKGAFSIL